MSTDPPGISAGPIETEPLDYPTPGDFPTTSRKAEILGDVFRAAGVHLGAYDERIATWLAQTSDWSTFAVIVSWVARAATAREPTRTVALPGRFDATPAEVDRHLRRILAEDVYLRYQQAIGGHAVMEASKDLRMEVVLPNAPDAKQWREAANYIDPRLHGGPYPSQLLCSQHDGFGPCPGAPRCTPKEND